MAAMPLTGDRFVDPDSQEEAPGPSQVRALHAAIAALSLFATWFGWRTFWFLTDDAYISFRYAGNAMLGRGFVWNPAPFLPVEGYTSFLWTALLTGIWKLTGLMPPVVCNWLSLACGVATLAMVSRIALEMPLPWRSTSVRTGLWTLILVGTIANRTFLAWLSSGLETALHNLLMTLWVWAALRDVRHALWLTSAASLLALTRPDGLLFAVATPVLLFARHWSHGIRLRAYVFAPFLTVLIHLLFRRFTYGEWLPNTYFAKHVAAWPMAGVLYAAAFVIEYGVWFWGLIALAWILRWTRDGSKAAALSWARNHAPQLIMLGSLAAHVGYYTLIIGGDHFEFRVYSHLIPFIFLSGAWCAAWAFDRGRDAIVCLALLVLISLPIPWTHFSITKNLNERAKTFTLIAPVSDHLPFFLEPLGLAWDELQIWLIRHAVCVRHQEHKVFWMHLAKMLPSRNEGMRIDWSTRPVLTSRSVGLAGWVLQNVAIIDDAGLNDRFVARLPIAPTAMRLMAHDRHAPETYKTCFRPNVSLLPKGGVRVVERKRPLTDDEIRYCESFFYEQLGSLR